MIQTIDKGMLAAFRAQLVGEERAVATVEKYLREVSQFACWLGARPLDKAAVSEWKNTLVVRYAVATVNGKLSALNRFLCASGRRDACVRQLRRQRRAFRDTERDLSRDDFVRLVTAARRRGRERLALIMETLCSGGLRVSELAAVTVAAVQTGRANIHLKGKSRTILLATKLCRKLRQYAKKQKITSGAIFRTTGGNVISRKQVWAEMKALAPLAGIDPRKVFPHNLRHLFASVFYKTTKDIVKLADVLGHSSIDTTRLYLLTTGQEHARLLDALHLVT